MSTDVGPSPTEPGTVAVFVHGIGSSAATWEPLLRLFRQDAAITSSLRLITFEYDTGFIPLRFYRLMPDLETISLQLRTYFDTKLCEYERVVFVTHSQGGLVVQRFISRMLSDGQARALAPIRMVVHIACPNAGADLSRSIRKLTGLRHPQAAELEPVHREVIAAQRQIIAQSLNATELTDNTCPIEYRSYSATGDSIVRQHSSLFVFPSIGGLPGSHTSVINTPTAEHQTFLTLRKLLLRACSIPIPVSSVNQKSIRRPKFTHTTTTNDGAISTTVVVEIFTRKELKRFLNASRNGDGEVD